MKIKDGVILAGLQLQMRDVMIVVGKVYKKYGQEAVITSGLDGEHSDGSYHPFGFALDFRTRFFDEDTRLKVFQEIKKELRAISPYYDLLLHKTHMHTEFDAKRAGLI